MKLLEALETIKEECESHERCHNCPLRKESLEIGKNNCSVVDINPMYWNLKTVVEVPRLFK